MRILFIIEYFPRKKSTDVRGGLEMRAFSIAAELSKKHQITVVTSREPDQPRIQLLGKIKIYRVGRERNYTNSGQIIKRLTFMMGVIIQGVKLDFDLVEADGFIAWFPALTLAKLKQKKSVMLVADTIETYLSKNYSVISSFMKLYEKLMIRSQWDAIIAISNVVAEKITKIYPRVTKIKTIYCGVRPSLYKSIKTKKRANFSICSISRFVEYKRINDLIEALIIVSKTIPKISLDIVGQGEDFDKIKNLCQKFNLNNVRLHGFIPRQNEVIKILKQAHIFCLASVVEGFGISTVEAFASGIPVILADIPVNHEVTQDRGVLFFKPKDAEDLAKKIIRLYKNKNLYNRLKYQGLAMAEKYDWKIISKQTLRLYENLLIN